MKTITKLRLLLVTLSSALTIFFIAGITLAWREKGLGSADVAGWVQAIGATFGIAIAIYLPWQQRQDSAREAEQRQRDSAFRVALAFRDELVNAAGHFNGKNVVELLRETPGDIFNLIIPIPGEPFPIYKAIASRITEIDDERVRRSIIQAYAGLMGTFEVTTLNNRLLGEYGDLLRRRHVENIDALSPELNERTLILASLRTQMRGILMHSIAEVHAAILLLDRTISGTHDDYSPYAFIDT